MIFLIFTVLSNSGMKKKTHFIRTLKDKRRVYLTSEIENLQ